MAQRVKKRAKPRTKVEPTVSIYTPLTHEEADRVFTWHSRFNIAEIQSAANSMPRLRRNREWHTSTIHMNCEALRQFLCDILFGEGDLVVMRKQPSVKIDDVS